MLLARNETTTWAIVFDPDDASLFVELTIDHTPDVDGRMTIDDFLASVPADDVHAEAIASLTSLLTVIAGPTAANVDWPRNQKSTMAWAAFCAYCLAFEEDFRKFAKVLDSLPEDETPE